MSTSAWTTAGIVIGAIAGIVGLVAACSAAFVRSMRVVALVVRFLDTWNGHGEGHARTPGMAERMDSQDAELARIRAEVLPNGGGSLRDAVDEVRRRLETHLTETEEARHLFAEHLRGTDDGSH